MSSLVRSWDEAVEARLFEVAFDLRAKTRVVRGSSAPDPSTEELRVMLLAVASKHGLPVELVERWYGRSGE